LVEAMARLLPQLNPHAPLPGLADLQRVIDSGTCDLFTVRKSPDSPIAGTLTLAVFRTPIAWHAWVEDVVVDQASRGEGLGRLLLTAAIERARERGATRIDLTSRPEREAANRLYQSMGFQQRTTNLYRLTLV